MYALTIRNPWAYAIIHLGKDVENRMWSTEYRGPLAIHAGRTHDDTARLNVPLDSLVYGAIIGTVDIVDCARNSRSRWAEPGCWHWILANPRALTTPISCRGQQGLWTVDIIKQKG